MRNIYLIFRRDYLGYVKAWGFWLSLAAVPALMLVGSLFALFAAQSSPIRYYTVIEPGKVFAEAIDAEFERSEAAAMAQEIAGQMQLPEGAAQNGAMQSLRERKFIEVPPPAEDIDGLRPYLLGERLVSGPQGDKPLFAALILSADGKTLEYWSDDVSINSLRYEAQDAARRLARKHALEAAGLDPDFIQNADDAAVDVPARRIRTVAEQESTGAEVTLADKAPVFVAGALAYFLWLMVFSIIQYLLMGTIEERSNKIFDTLLTSVRMPELLAGKLLAVFAVTSTMMLVWGLFALSGSAFLATQVPGCRGHDRPLPVDGCQPADPASRAGQLCAWLHHVRHDLHGARLPLRHDPGSADPAQPDDDPADAAHVRDFHRVSGPGFSGCGLCDLDPGVHALPADPAHAA
jgi:ABC-2 type transport system permease protein